MPAPQWLHFSLGPCLGCGVAYVCAREGDGIGRDMGREYTGESGEGGEEKMGSIGCLFRILRWGWNCMLCGDQITPMSPFFVLMC